MPNSDDKTHKVIPHELLLSRLAQSDQMRDFFIQMWLQNPLLAKQGGATVMRLISPLVRNDQAE
jgi:hypothetical protein